MAFPLTEEQRRVVDHRGGELLVSAAAGSGKTRVLVERLLDRVTAEGVDIDRFLVITFTRAAAAELRSRVAAELNSRLAGNPSDTWLRRQATLVYKAPISTIHSLCGDVLREFGHVLDLDPDFRLLDEGETGLIRGQVLEDLVESRYETMENDPDFALLLDTLSAGRDDSRLLTIASDLHGKLQAHPDPMGWLAEMEKLWALEGVQAPEDTVWGRELLDETGRKARHWAGELRRAKELCAADPGLEANYGPSLAGGAGLFDALAAAAGRGWAAVRALGTPSFLTAGRKKMDGALPEVEQVKQIRADAKEALEKLRGFFAQDGAAVLDDLRAVAPAVRGLFALVRDFDAALKREKTRRRVLDFDDLEHLTVELLKNREVAGVLSGRFVEVMVDEYQDTNAVQNAIFDALTQGGKTLFQVGDVKQSIYRFRLADPTIFLDKYARFPSEGEAGTAKKAVLTRNFRSRPQVLGAVNDLFRAIMSPGMGELEYSGDQALRAGAAFPENDAPVWDTELDVLLTDAPEEDEETEKVPKDLQEARFVAQRLKNLLLTGFQVTDGDALRPVRPGDMAVLLRSPGSVTHHYARAFREAGLPWQAEGSGELMEAVEVQVALSLLQVVDNPRQDVPLIAALRSPVWAMSADRLAQLRAVCPGRDFYTALKAGAERGEADCAGFLAELEGLRLEAADRPAHELLWLLYDRTNLLGVFSAMDGGADRRANLLCLYEYARSFEGAGHKGLYRFLAFLRRLREGGRGLTGPRPARGESAVTLLSIHRSKGLEFPVVVVAGLNRRFNRTDLYAPLLFHTGLGVGPKRLDEGRGLEYPTLARTAIARRLDREMLAEELRLLYVAMTRAKDKLILTCALPNGEKRLRALAPWAGDPVAPERLAECQSAAEWVLLYALSRPDALELRRVAGGVLPAATRMESRWDVRALTMDQGEGRWVSPEGTAAAGELPESVTAGYGWVYPHAGAVDTPSKLTATQLKGRDLDREAAEAAPAAPQPPVFRRPRFLQEDQGLTAAEKGTAVHLAMQFFDFSQSGDLETIIAELDRLEEKQFLTPEQRSAVPAESILAFFHSDTGKALLAAPRLEREFKFSLLADAGAYYPGVGEGEQVLFQGVIDCWFEDEDGGLTVLDFKTDRVPHPRLYAPQVASYAAALERMTGKKVVRRLLWFFADSSVHEV